MSRPSLPRSSASFTDSQPIHPQQLLCQALHSFGRYAETSFVLESESESEVDLVGNLLKQRQLWIMSRHRPLFSHIYVLLCLLTESINYT